MRPDPVHDEDTQAGRIGGSMSRDETTKLCVEQLGLALEASQDPVVVYDAQAHIVLVNERLLAATGYAAEELVGQPVLVLLPTALREQLTPRMLAYARDPVPRGIGEGPMGAIERKDGSTFEAQMANAPVATVGGDLVVSTIREVRHLSLDEIEFRGLLESNPDATLICTPDGNVVLSNSDAVRLFQQEHVAMFNQPLLSLFPSTQASSLTQWMRACCDASVAGLVPPDAPSLELDVVRRDESVVPVELSLSSLRTDQGLTYRVSVRDISERQRLQREAEAKKDGFLATVSHELRTPLTSVLGYGELLQDLEEGDLSEHARSLLDVVVRNARRELRLVDDLLMMVQIGDGAFRIQAGQVNLFELVQDAVEASVPAAERARLHVSVAQAGEDAFVQGDSDRLSQAVDNLLTNSFKFSPPASEVAVSLSADPRAVTVSFTNQGEGIPSADVDHVFDRLYRGHNARVAETQGVGLGLSIVRSIVEAHHGSVSVTSTPTSTCFAIELPRAGQGVVDVPDQRPGRSAVHGSQPARRLPDPEVPTNHVG